MSEKTEDSREKIRIIEGNGYNLIYETFPEFRSIASGIWFPIGSVNEDDASAGISHFIEHLIFKGTRRYRAREVSERFDSLGANVNAFTSKEHTCYYVHLVSDNHRPAFELLNHILSQPAFRKKDIESERKVILQEIAMYEDSPDEQVHDLFASVVFGNSHLGRPIIGTAESVSSITRDMLIDYYEKYYLGRPFVVSAAGRVDEQQILDVIDQGLAARKTKPAGSPARPAVHQGQPGRHLLLKAKDTAQAHLCVGFPVFGIGHPDRFALAVLNSIFGGMMSSRLFVEVREKRGLAYSVYAYHSLYHQRGYSAVYAGTDPEKAAQTLKIILSEFERLVNETVSGKELSKAKENTKARLVLTNESMNARMLWLGKIMTDGDDLLTIEEIIERIEGVTADDVRRVAADYFATRPYVAAIGSLNEAKLSKIIENYGGGQG